MSIQFTVDGLATANDKLVKLVNDLRLATSSVFDGGNEDAKDEVIIANLDNMFACVETIRLSIGAIRSLVFDEKVERLAANFHGNVPGKPSENPTNDQVEAVAESSTCQCHHVHKREEREFVPVYEKKKDEDSLSVGSFTLEEAQAAGLPFQMPVIDMSSGPWAERFNAALAKGEAEEAHNKNNSGSNASSETAVSDSVHFGEQFGYDAEESSNGFFNPSTPLQPSVFPPQNTPVTPVSANSADFSFRQASFQDDSGFTDATQPYHDQATRPAHFSFQYGGPGFGNGYPGNGFDTSFNGGDYSYTQSPFVNNNFNGAMPGYGYAGYGQQSSGPSNVYYSGMQSHGNNQVHPNAGNFTSMTPNSRNYGPANMGARGRRQFW